MISQQILYGGDYNPEQWLDEPEILKKDVQYMKEAGINAVSMGMFSWSALEPAEDEYHLEWLDERINTLYETESTRFLQHLQAHARNGWQTGIRRYFAWMKTGCGSCSGQGITIVILRRYTGRRYGKSICCWRSGLALIRE